MAETRVVIEGADTLRATLDRAADDIAALDDAPRQAADLIVSNARARAPRRTGRLAASLRGLNDGGRAVATSDLIYSPPIHWGWRARSINPNRFLLEAAEETERQWVAFYEKDVQQALDKVKGA